MPPLKVLLFLTFRSFEKLGCSLRPVWCLRFGTVPLANPSSRNPKTVSPDAPHGPEYWEKLRTVGVDAGLHTLGVAPAEVMHRALGQLHERIDNDLVNGMKFTFLRPERSTNPAMHLEGAKSIIVGVRSYAIDDNQTSELSQSPLGKIARYAWVDHYGFLKDSLNLVADQLRSDGHRAVVFADDNAMVDRETAWLAGIGWYGKNANILLPGHGSFFVIGCVVTTADLPMATPLEDGCGACSRCIPACPTGAIVENGVIDANKCLSWLLQKPGIFDREHRIALHDRIYGCDDCQTVCPPTRRAGTTESSELVQSGVDVVAWLHMDDVTLNESCQRWYVHQRDMTWIRRNLLINIGNVGDPTDDRVMSTLRTYLQHPRGELRAHAVWAAARLGARNLIDFNDPDPMVREELLHLPALRTGL
ncbi:MAG: tRNA epoxyqueuosine(34) reductase QueG [Actinobacteria bacterium]|nr:tRNA epoxyqueuosine(34) reductase QueG [Actinomycetota bacterium]MSZ81040.1 tRNA epoxyqueuosine(34) reductase QueG [Actinomycetota bacterium]